MVAGWGAAAAAPSPGPASPGAASGAAAISSSSCWCSCGGGCGGDAPRPVSRSAWPCCSRCCARWGRAGISTSDSLSLSRPDSTMAATSEACCACWPPRRLRLGPGTSPPAGDGPCTAALPPCLRVLPLLPLGATPLGPASTRGGATPAARLLRRSPARPPACVEGPGCSCGPASSALGAHCRRTLTRRLPPPGACPGAAAGCGASAASPAQPAAPAPASGPPARASCWSTACGGSSCSLQRRPPAPRPQAAPRPRAADGGCRAPVLPSDSLSLTATAGRWHSKE